MTSIAQKPNILNGSTLILVIVCLFLSISTDPLLGNSLDEGILSQTIGIIGSNDSHPIDYVDDNTFYIEVTQDLENKEIYLTYDLYGFETYNDVPKLINHNLSKGGQFSEFNTEWTSQKERIPGSSLNQGLNSITFTIPNTADFIYKIKNISISISDKTKDSEQVEIYECQKIGDQLFLGGALINYDEVESILYGDEIINHVNGQFQYIGKFKEEKELELTFKYGETLNVTLEPSISENTSSIKPNRTQFISIDSVFGSELFSEQLYVKSVTNQSVESLKIIGLSSEDLPVLEYNMLNVTKDFWGYKYYNNQLSDLDEYVIGISYDPEFIPDGYTEYDIVPFSFNKENRRWDAHEVIEVDSALQMIFIEMKGYSDVVNTILQQPESPSGGGFVPTELKNISVANPFDQVELIAPPVPNNQGTNNLSFPLKFPEGRRGIEPIVSINYNSEGDNASLLGQGWSLFTPSISIDTRWGAARYDAKQETEFYLLNGEALYPLPRLQKYEQRKSGDKQFWRRIEGKFDRILRKETPRGDYYWEVTDKSGVKYFYGADSGGNLSSALIRTASNDIIEWPLLEIIDLHGNTVKYSYDKKKVTFGSFELLCTGITYTGHKSTQYKAPYNIEFNYRENREDKTNSGRLGVLVANDHLLTDIKVQILEGPDYKTFRRYGFDISPGRFGKSLLDSITEYDEADKEFYKHKFDYFGDHDDNIALESKGDIQVSIDAPVGESSVLSETYSKSTSSGGAFTFGFGFDDTKSNSAGIRFSHTSSKSEGRVMFADITGDGKPDKIVDNGDNLFYYLNTSDGDNISFDINPNKIFGVKDFYRSVSSTNGHGFEVNIGFQAIPFYGGYENGRTNSKVKSYVSDVNGDGFLDIVQNGNVLFNKRPHTNGEIKFEANTNGLDIELKSSLPSTDLIDIQTFSEEEKKFNPLLDAVRYWVAPFDGKINIKSKANLINDSSDGVQLFMQFPATSGKPYVSKKLAQKDKEEKINETLDIKKDGVVFFIASSNVNGENDEVSWGIDIEYKKLYDSKGKGLDFDKNLEDYNGTKLYKYNAAQDFKTNSSGMFYCQKKGKLVVSTDIRSTLSKEDRDDLELQIFYNNEKKARKTKSLSGKEFKLNVDSTDVLKFKVFSKRSIAWSRLHIGTMIRYEDKVVNEDTTYMNLNYSIYTAKKNHNYPFKISKNYGKVELNVNKYQKLIAYDDKPMNADDAFVLNIKRLQHKNYDKKKNESKYQSEIKPIRLDVKNGVIKQLDKENKIDVTKYFKIEKGKLISGYTYDIELICLKPELFDKLPTGISGSLKFDYSVINNGNTNTKSDLYNIDLLLPILKSKPLEHLYRQWGNIAFNSTYAKVQNDLYRIIDPIDLETGMNISKSDIKNAEDEFGKIQNDTDVNGFNYNAGKSSLKYPVTHLFPLDSSAVYYGIDSSTYVSRSIMKPSRLGDDDIYEYIPSNSKTNNVFFLPNKYTRSKNKSISGGAMLGFAKAKGSNSSIIDVFDMNGDRFPDIIYNNRVQYSLNTGVLEKGSNTLNISGNINQNTYHGKTTTAGIPGPGIPFNSNNNKTNGGTGTPSASSATGSVSSGKATTTSNTEYDLIDINGDGLLDRVHRNGTVNFNLGYTFTQSNKFSSSIDLRSSNSTNKNFGAGFNLVNFSFSGGVSKSTSNDTITKSLFDINGDGLPDKVWQEKENIKYLLNLGTKFSSTVNVLSAASPTLFNEGQANDKAYNGSYTIAISPKIIPIKSCINPFFVKSKNTSHQNATLMDINGDGFPDALSGDGTHLRNVKLSTIGETNKLKTIHRPANAKIDFTYQKRGNTTEMPISRYVLNGYEFYDGFEDDGDNVLHVNVEYKGGNYSRKERELYGFGEVKVIESNDKTTSYRSRTLTYDNSDFFLKSMENSQSITDETDGANNLVLRKNINEFTKKRIDTFNVALITYPQLSKETTQYWEKVMRDSNKPKYTEKSYEYDKFGNLIKMTDFGEPEVAGDDRVSTAVYSTNQKHFDKHLVGLTTSSKIEGTSPSKTYRENSAQYDDDGNIEWYKRKNNATSESKTSYTYNDYGLLETKDDPKNAKGDNIKYEYKYDKKTGSFVEEIIKKGYSTDYKWMYKYDPKYGLQTKRTSLNGHSIITKLDKKGRPSVIIGPYQTDYTIKNIYGRLKTDRGAYASTSHFDEFNKGNDIDTYVIYDGRGRELQVKKDANVDGETSEVLVTNKKIYDAYNRLRVEYYPKVTSKSLNGSKIRQAGDNSSYVGSYNDTLKASRIYYDILDRVTKNKLSDDTYFEYVHSIEREKSDGKRIDLFAKESYDPNGHLIKHYTNTRSLFTNTKEYLSKPNLRNYIHTMYQFDPVNQLTTVTNDSLHQYVFTYDYAGRMVTKRDPVNKGKSYIYAYDGLDNTIHIQTPNLSDAKESISYKYEFDRLKEIVFPNKLSKNIKYRYSDIIDSRYAKGRLDTIIDDGGRLELAYGKLGEKIEEVRKWDVKKTGGTTYNPTHKIRYEYDTWNRIKSITYPDAEKIDYSYDLGGKLYTIIGEVDGTKYRYLDRKEYDAVGNITHVQLANGVNEYYNYDRRQRLTKSVIFESDKATDKFRKIQDNRFTYDNMNNVIAVKDFRDNLIISEPGGKVDYTFEYDSLYRIKKSVGTWNKDVHQSNYSVEYRYDKLHNMTQKNQSHSYVKQGETPEFIDDKFYSNLSVKRQDGQIKSNLFNIKQGYYDNTLKGTHFKLPVTYTVNKNKVTKSRSVNNGFFEYDNNGNLIDKNLGEYEYLWDDINRLIEINKGGEKHYYKYDHENNRIYHESVNSVRPVSKTFYLKNLYTFRGETESKHVYEGTSLLLTKVNNSGIVSRTGKTDNYIYYYHKGMTGSTNIITNFAGKINQTIHYFPYGELFVEEKLDPKNNDREPHHMYKFNGKEYDENTGLYYAAISIQPGIRDNIIKGLGMLAVANSVSDELSHKEQKIIDQIENDAPLIMLSLMPG